MWWLAAAPLSRVSSALVAEVQTEATLMLGARVEGGEEKEKACVSPPAVNYSTQGKI